MFPFKRILIPTDFSASSNAAVSYAEEMAKGAEVQLFHLHVPGRTGENFEADFPIGPFVRSAAAPPSASEAPAGPRREYAIRIGTPAEEINRYARDREIDVIVMGTHGRSGVPHLVMGSVTEEVLRTTGCPVLVIRGR